MMEELLRSVEVKLLNYKAKRSLAFIERDALKDLRAVKAQLIMEAREMM